MDRRHEVYNQTMEYIEALEGEGKILVIRPPHKLPAGHIEHDPGKLQATYDIGVAEGKKWVEKVKEYL